VAGRFDIEHALGRGGMGEVFLARDRQTGGRVALKLLRDDVSPNRRQRQRLEREGRLASTLRHPNICAVYAVGQDGDRPYIAMEHVGGETLRDRLDRGPMPVVDVLRVAHQLSSALEHARLHRIVHRDLTTANVLLSRDGVVKILDFGLARLEDAPGSTTGLASDDGLLAGTAEYLSPEQATGRPVDHRSDLFSLGVVLYELLTGRAPFRSSATLETLWQVVNVAPAPITGPDVVTRRLAVIVHRLLAKDRAQRYQSAGDVHRDLARLDRGEGRRTAGRRRARPGTVDRPSTGRVERGSPRPGEPRTADRERLWRPLAGMAAGLVLTLGGLVPGTVWLCEAAEAAWLSAASRRTSVWVGDATGQHMTRVGTAVPTADAVLVNNQGSVIYAMSTGGGDDLWSATGEAAPRLIVDRAGQPALTPDGSTIVFRRTGAEAGLYRIGVSGTGLRRLLPGDVAHPTILPDGRTALFERIDGAARGLWTIALDGSALRAVNDRTPGSRPIVSPDGRLVAFERHGAVIVCRLPDCPEETRLPIRSARAWTPDSQGLAYTGPPDGANVWVMPVAGGPGRQVTHFGDRAITSLAWSPDGRRLAVTRARSLTDLPFLTPRP
jgi:Tol biopolymer transport system component